VLRYDSSCFRTRTASRRQLVVDVLEQLWEEGIHRKSRRPRQAVAEPHLKRSLSPNSDSAAAPAHKIPADVEALYGVASLPANSGSAFRALQPISAMW